MPHTYIPRRASILPFAAVLAPLLASYAILVHFLEPLPLMDDYQALLQFSLDHLRLASPSARWLHIVSSQHNEYKFILEHLLVAAELTLTHRIDIDFLQVLGDLFVLGNLILLWFAAFPASTPQPRRLLLFVPVSLVACSLNYWDALDFAMNGITTFAIQFFLLLTLLLLTRQPARLLAASLSAVCGCLISPIAFLLGPLGLLVLWSQRTRQAFAGRAVFWTASFVPAFAAFLYRYVWMPPHAAKAFYDKPAFFFSFLGSASPSKWGAAPLGALILCAVFLLVYKRWDRVNPCLFYYALLLVASALIAAQGRAAFGVFGSVSERYQIHSNMLLIIVYVFAVHLYPKAFRDDLLKSPAYLGLVAVAVLFTVHADHTAIRGYVDRNRQLMTGYRQYLQDPAVNSPVTFADLKLAAASTSLQQADRLILNQAVQQKIYRLPKP